VLHIVGGIECGKAAKSPPTARNFGFYADPWIRSSGNSPSRHLSE
jgi:hypothetical protein